MPQAEDRITGQMQVYDDCSSISAVDAHIRMVRTTRTRIIQSGKYPELPPKYLADIDLLLDRRRWLEILREEAPC